ncbi:GPI anchored cell wall protein [Xylaria nigripes]|nr:GPI anchored cell wall protein [Xylaria nigripes]
MRYTAFVPFLLSAVAAAPYELISKRELKDHEWGLNKRTGCPGYLENGEFEFPHYITQISAREPDKAFGSQYTAVFTPNDISTVYSFDIPKSRADANCTLEFLFPRLDQLRTSSFSYKGAGTFSFRGYNAGSCPDSQTTFNNQPDPSTLPPHPPIHMEPGYAYTIDVGPCSFAAGKCVAGCELSSPTLKSMIVEN